MTLARDNPRPQKRCGAAFLLFRLIFLMFGMMCSMDSIFSPEKSCTDHVPERQQALQRVLGAWVSRHRVLFLEPVVPQRFPKIVIS